MAPPSFGAGRPLPSPDRLLRAAGSPEWSAWIGNVTDILAERHGGLSVQAFSRDPARTAREVVALAQEAGSHAGLAKSRSAAPPVARSGVDDASS